MEQNLVNFPNSMYFHVGPYTPYFGFGYRGIKSVPTMRPPMFDPLINPMASPKAILRIAQIEIVTNYEEPSNEDKDYYERKHNSKMPQIVPTEKSYHERRGRPSRLEMLVDHLLMDKLYLSTMVVIATLRLGS
jgi:hypothetical protein